MQVRGERELQEIEALVCGPCAQLSAWATHRHRLDAEGRRHELRTAFQHDRDRIVHSRAFRRLKHKTQVFIPYRNDHQRTRLTHTIEVMQIGRTIARCLGLNEDLTEAIALAHDLGHTPFGHVGERTLHEIMVGEALQQVIPGELTRGSAGFRHNAQSLRVADHLESRYEHPGLNLSDQVREGILKHTSWSTCRDYPGTDWQGLNPDREQAHFEGQVVAVADEIAQQTHDLEDGMRARIVDLAEVMQLEMVKQIEKKNVALRDGKLDRYTKQNTIIRSLIHVLVVDVIHESARGLEEWRRENGVTSHEDFAAAQARIDGRIAFGPETRRLFEELSGFVGSRVIRSRQVELNDESGRHFIGELFRIYFEDPGMLEFYVLERFRKEKKLKHLHLLARELSEEELSAEASRSYRGDPDFLRLICDFIAGMSNTFAIREYEKWVMPFHV